MSRFSQEIRWNVQHDKSMYASPLNFEVEVPDILKKQEIVWNKYELEDIYYPDPRDEFRYVGYHRSGKGRVAHEDKTETIEEIVYGSKEKFIEEVQTAVNHNPEKLI